MGFTTSRKTAAAALAAAVLIGGGIAAVAPAAAGDGGQYAATNWKKVWKNDLQQYADKRYYTKKKSDKKYATKTALGSYYTKTQTDATYAYKSLTYTKTESDAKYAPDAAIPRRSTRVRAYQRDPRTWPQSAAQPAYEPTISFGYTLAAAPTALFIRVGGAATASCTGTAAAPAQPPGYLCIYEGAAAELQHADLPQRARRGSAPVSARPASS